MMLAQDGIENARTKAELRRAVLRTAALVHWRHWGFRVVNIANNFAPAHAPVCVAPAGEPLTAPAGLFDHARGDDAERLSISSFHSQIIA